MRWLSTLTAALVAAGTMGVLAGPAVAADDPVDLRIQRTLSTPTDLFDASPTVPTVLDLNPANLGTTDQPATLTVGAPAGWQIEIMDRTLIDGETCARTDTAYVCDIPVLAAGDNRSNQFTVLAPASTPVGAITTFPVTLDPAPGVTDADPSNNSTQVRFRNVGTSEVEATVTQSATTVGVGGTVTFTVTLTNAGPDATVGQAGGFRVETETVDGFEQLAPRGPGNVFQGGGAGPPNAGPDYAFEYDLAAGASAVYSVTWRGLVLGAVGQLVFATGREPQSYLADPLVVRSADVTVVAAAPGTSPSAPTTPAPTASAPELAATGTTHLSGQLLAAFAALVIGSGLALGAHRRGRRSA